jgi:ParB/RepB/Spo0J family partition protein
MGAKLEFEFKKHPAGGFLISPDLLVVNLAENGRRKTEIDDAFVGSMLKGQDTPCTVRTVTVTGGDKRWKLAWGYRRWMAAKRINDDGLSEQPYLLWVTVNDQLSDQTAFLKNLRENKDRQDTTILDDALNIGRLKELYKWTDVQIAEEYGKTDAWVCNTRKLLKLDPKYHDLIERRIITAAQAQVLADAEDAWREERYQEILASGMCKWSTDALKTKAREENAISSSSNKQLKAGAIVKFYEALADPEEGADVPAHVQEFAKITLKWLKGQRGMGDNMFYTQLEVRLRTMKQLENATS